jgi:hypothetical protein
VTVAHGMAEKIVIQIDQKQINIKIKIVILSESLIMRKMYKLKKRSCSMCKPHKMGWACRWKARDYDKLVQDEKEIKNKGE